MPPSHLAANVAAANESNITTNQTGQISVSNQMNGTVSIQYPANKSQAVSSQNISIFINASNSSSAPAGIEFGNYSLVLEDLTLPTGIDKASCASLAVYDLENGTVLDRLEVCPGQDAYWVAPDGHAWRIVVYETAPGYTLNEKWAKMAVFG